MLSLYEKIFATIWPLLYLITNEKKQFKHHEVVKFTANLEPGDLIMRKTHFPSLLRSLFKNLKSGFSHGVLYLGEGQVFDYSFPRAKILPLHKFIDLSDEFLAIRVKTKITGLKQKLRGFARERQGAPFSHLNLAFQAYTVFLYEVKSRVSEQESRDIRKRTNALLEYGAPFLTCISTILQPWLHFIPQIKQAYQRGESLRRLIAIPLAPYDLLVMGNLGQTFIIENPELFQFLQEPSPDTIKSVFEIVKPIPVAQAYQSMSHSTKFLTHTRYLISIAGLASIAQYSQKITSTMKKKLRTLQQLTQKLAEACVEHAISPSKSTSIIIYSLICSLYQHLEQGSRPAVEEAVTLQKIKQELNESVVPKL